VVVVVVIMPDVVVDVVLDVELDPATTVQLPALTSLVQELVPQVVEPGTGVDVALGTNAGCGSTLELTSVRPRVKGSHGVPDRVLAVWHAGVESQF